MSIANQQEINMQQHSIQDIELLHALREAQDNAQDAKTEAQQAQKELAQSQEKIDSLAEKALEKYTLL
jgi:hypothetical protein